MTRIIISENGKEYTKEELLKLFRSQTKYVKFQNFLESLGI